MTVRQARAPSRTRGRLAGYTLSGWRGPAVAVLVRRQRRADSIPGRERTPAAAVGYVPAASPGCCSGGSAASLGVPRRSARQHRRNGADDLDLSEAEPTTAGPVAGSLALFYCVTHGTAVSSAARAARGPHAVSDVLRTQSIRVVLHECTQYARCIHPCSLPRMRRRPAAHGGRTDRIII